MKAKITIEVDEDNVVTISEENRSSVRYDLKLCARNQWSLLKNIVDSLDDYLEFTRPPHEEEED